VVGIGVVLAAGLVRTGVALVVGRVVAMVVSVTGTGVTSGSRVAEACAGAGVQPASLS
jgi:hypothetical protein